MKIVQFCNAEIDQIKLNDQIKCASMRIKIMTCGRMVRLVQKLVYVILTVVVTFITLFLTCKPFSSIFNGLAIAILGITKDQHSQRSK